MRVLSIDLDSCFDGITYAKYMNYDIIPDDAWNIIYYLEGKNIYGINTSVDIRAVGIVCDILSNKANHAQVRVIDEHHELISIMEECGCRDASVYNIDAHHDINYGNDNAELNCENWVLHGKAKRLIGDYHWVCRPMSELSCDSSFKYYRECLCDIDISSLPEYDLVVLCVSHQFTPNKHYKTLLNVLLSHCNECLNYFREIYKDSIPNDLFSGDNIGDYLIDNSLPDIKRVFNYKDCYIIYEADDNSLSIINKGCGFGIGVCKEVVDLIINEYDYCTFTWDVNIRNNILINRLINNYNILEDKIYCYNNKNIRQVKLQGGNK